MVQKSRTSVKIPKFWPSITVWFIVGCLDGGYKNVLGKVPSLENTRISRKIVLNFICNGFWMEKKLLAYGPHFSRNREQTENGTRNKCFRKYNTNIIHLSVYYVERIKANENCLLNLGQNYLPIILHFSDLISLMRRRS